MMITQQAQDLIAAFPLPTLIVGADQRIVASNSAAEKMLGGTVFGLNHVSVLRQPAILDAIAATQRSGVPGQAGFTGRDGPRDVVYQAMIASITGGISVIFEDRTAVADVTQQRRDFVANVSHELRTPLTAVMGFIETLRGPARSDPAAQSRFLGMMAEEASRMQQLVDDLLSLSRVENQERQRPTDTVDLAWLIPSVIDRMGPLATQAGARLDHQRLSQPLPVPGDEPQLRQLLTNLIENAIKYGGRADPVVITVRGSAYEPALQADGVRITVRDQGEGIAAHHLARLTERFYRVDSHRSRAVGGTGLGLAIVKHIVNRHRGRFRITSVLGQGTRAEVILPVLSNAAKRKRVGSSQTP